MPRCEECQRDFSTEEGFAQHMNDKHRASSHDKDQEKKIARAEQRSVERGQTIGRRRGKTVRNAVIIGIVILVIAAIAVTMRPKSTIEDIGNVNAVGIDLTGIPTGVIHWHADVDVFLCGTEKRLPEAGPSGEIGSGILHTHDRLSNQQSMPGTDGNGIVHIEGAPRSDPEGSIMGRFMQFMNIRFEADQIGEYKNGDLCDGKPGKVVVELNGQEKTPADIVKYIPRDRDKIVIKFEAQQQSDGTITDGTITGSTVNETVNETTVNTTGNDTSMTAQSAVIEMTSSGFSPSKVTIAKGGSVTWINADSVAHWPASAMHPTHTVYPGANYSEPGSYQSSQACVSEGVAKTGAFDPCKGIAPGANWTFTFVYNGTWFYHDHLNPSLFGSVVVTA